MPRAASSGPQPPCPYIPEVTSGASAVGALQVGSNSPTGNIPGLIVGTDFDGNNDGKPIVWDDDPTRPFDTGWVSFRMIVEAQGSQTAISLTIIQPDGTQTSVAYTGPAATTVTDVQITSEADADMTVSWKSVVATYYSSGTPTDTNSLPDNCVPNPVSNVSELNPSTSGNNRVVLTGMLRMQALSTGSPPPTSMTAQFYVFSK